MVSPPDKKQKKPTPIAMARGVCHLLYRFGRPHKTWFIRGVIAAVFVVAARLALPWPLRAVANEWVSSSGGTRLLPANWPDWLTVPVVMGVAFLGILVTLGLTDAIERLCFARFSIATVKDIRSDAYAEAVRSDPRSRTAGSADLVARLIGDTARLKTGLKGFLVHVATNVFVFVGVTIVLFFMDTMLGLIFAIAGLVTLAVTIWGATNVFRRSLNNRTKEGKLAATIHRGLRSGPDEAKFARINRSSGDDEASVTRISGIATWTAYLVFGIAVLVALVIGSRGVDSGRVAPGDMVLFMMYALMMRGPIVRLTRQGTRSGKIFGSGARLDQILSRFAPDDAPAPVAASLGGVLHFRAATAKIAKRRGDRPRVGPIDCEITAGERVALIGDPGAGKTSLLQLLSGLGKVTSGTIMWGESDLDTVNGWEIARRVSFVPQNPTWPRGPLHELFGGAGADAAARSSCLNIEPVRRIIADLPKGLDTVVGSSDLSPGERHLIAMAGMLRDDTALWLVDDPAAGAPVEVAELIIDSLVTAPTGITVIVAMSRPVHLDRFDRIVELQDGLVVFNGTPRDHHEAPEPIPCRPPEEKDLQWWMGRQRGGAG